MRSWNVKNGKNKIRTELFSQIKEHLPKPAKNALMMPGDTYLCVKEALQQGVIDKNTFIVAIEKDREIAQKLQKSLEQEGFTYEVINNKLENVYRDIGLKDLDIGHGFDLVYLDTCGCFTWAVKRRIENDILPMCDDNVQFAATFMNVPRGFDAYSVWEDAPSYWLKDYEMLATYTSRSNAKDITYTFSECVKKGNLNRDGVDELNLKCEWVRPYKNSTNGVPMLTFLFVPNTQHELYTRHKNESREEDLERKIEILQQAYNDKITPLQSKLMIAKQKKRATRVTPSFTGSTDTLNLNYV